MPQTFKSQGIILSADIGYMWVWFLFSRIQSFADSLYFYGNLYHNIIPSRCTSLISELHLFNRLISNTSICKAFFFFKSIFFLKISITLYVSAYITITMCQTVVLLKLLCFRYIVLRHFFFIFPHVDASMEL
jgi:hypothetical protein